MSQPANPPMTVAQLAEASGVSIATVKRKALSGKLPIILKVPGKTGAYLFEPSAVELLKNDRRRRPSTTSAAVLPAFVLPPVVEQTMQVLCALLIVTLIGYGLTVFAEHRRGRAPIAPLVLSDRHASALADADCTADPIRGRVYIALGIEFWRSAFGQWLYADGTRCAAVTDRRLLAALDARESRGWVL